MTAAVAAGVRRAGIAAIVLAAAALAFAAYLHSQRAAADEILANRALGYVQVPASIPFEADLEKHRHSMFLAAQEVELFLGSDSARRLPRTAEHAERALLARFVALELMLAGAEKTVTPPDKVVSLDEALRAFPTLAPLLPRSSVLTSSAYEPAIAELGRLASEEVTAAGLALTADRRR